jgi:hypothetical protein
MRSTKRVISEQIARMSSVVMSVSVLQQKALNAYSAEVIRACALKYGFDGEEAMRELSVSYARAEGKKPKATGLKKAVRVQPSIPLPFTGVAREDCCIGVKQNHGLYTQCFSAPGDSGLCKGCGKQASKNASGEPDCGVIAKRVMQGSEYRDSKGRAPVHYTKVMKKQKLTEEQVLAEAAKFGIEIEASHFAVPEAQQKRGRPKKATTSDTESETSASLATGDKKKARGRPKKAAKVVEVNATEDLFASLMEQAQSASPRPSASLAAGGGSSAAEAKEDDASSISASDSESDSEESKGSNSGNKKKTKKSKALSEEQLAEKAAKFLAKEAEKEKKAAAKAQAQQEKEVEKVKKAAEKEQAQQEKALAQQKKLAEKEAEKAKKLAEKEAEKALAQQKKEAAKAAKAEAPKKEKKTLAQQKKAASATATAPAIEEPVADLESESEEEETSDADEPVVAVKKFEHQGVTYLKSGDGILYSAKSQEVVGKWNEKTQMIDVYDGESEEEDSDSDDE